MLSFWFFIFVLGLVMGSFIGALTWRLPKNLGIVQGRSFCDSCHKKISWFDNIPLLSFFLLKGKCRYCQRRISIRYPLIELTTAFGFVGISFFLPILPSVFPWLNGLKNLNLAVSFFIFLLLIVVFVIDLEHQVILDEVVFLGWLSIIFIFLATNFSSTFAFVFAGFLGALIFLIIHLVTLGRGMGLGDVKLALFLGTMIGLKYLFVWLFLSFLTGALLGVFLVILKKTNLKAKIAFGPFMVVGFLVLFVFKDIIS